MRFRFVPGSRVAAVALAGAFAGVARALDFDDEDPEPPHAEIGMVYNYEIGSHAGCLPHHLVIVSGAAAPRAEDPAASTTHTGVVEGVATEAGTFSAWIALKDCDEQERRDAVHLRRLGAALGDHHVVARARRASARRTPRRSRAPACRRT